MNMKSLFVAVVYACVTIVFLSNCSGKKEEASAQEDHQHHAQEAGNVPEATAPQFQVDQAFQQQLAGVFGAYVTLKESFVATDAARVKSEASALAQALGKADMKLLTGVAHNDWMTYLGGMEGALKDMQASDDIEAQRTAFQALSDNLYKSIKAFGLGGATAYYEYCPMAFNNTGGYWLSDNANIRNPYFGDKMLTCGRVEETLK